MPDWLSDEWTAAVARSTGSLPSVGGASGSVDLAISTAPRKEVHIHWGYQDGNPADGAPGPDPGADLSLSISAADAVAVFDATVEPSVAFMRGRLKASGDNRLLLEFLASTRTAEFARWRAGVDELGSSD